MKIFFSISFILIAHLSYSQNKTSDVIYGLGYGYIKDGWGDIPGQIFYLTGQSITKKNWLSFSGRLAGTYIERRNNYDQYETLEKSNGINLEADVNFHLRYWRLNFYPSTGISLRYSSDQHINTMSMELSPNGQVVTFDVDYDRNNSIQLGYTLGFNLDTNVSKNLIIGIRYSGMAYINGNGFGSLTFNIKNKIWKL